MPTAWKRLGTRFGEFFAPMMQGTVSNPKVAGNLRLRFPTLVH